MLGQVVPSLECGRDQALIQFIVNGTSWVSMVSTQTDGPCSEAGSVQYDAANFRFKWCDGTNWKIMGDPLAAIFPSNLALYQTANERSFFVEWTAGVGFGPCKIQFQKDGLTWTDFPGPSLYDCDELGSFFPDLPGTNNWTNNFNATGVKVRLISTVDALSFIEFPQRATCVIQPNPASPTPVIDENCNSIWNDEGLDETPSAFAFTDVTNASFAALTVSNILQITGIDVTTVTITGPGTPEFRVCPDSTCSTNPAWTSTPETISNNQYLQLRLISSPSPNASVSVDVFVGTLSDNWSVSTGGNYQILALGFALGSRHVDLYRTDTWAKLPDPTPLPADSTEYVYSIAFNPLNTLLAVSNNAVAGGSSEDLRIYSLSSMTQIAAPTIYFSNQGFDMKFSPDGTRLAVAGNGTSPVIYNTSDWSRVSVGWTSNAGKKLAYNPNGSRLLLSYSGTPYLRVYDTANLSASPTVPTGIPSAATTGVAFNHDGSRAAVGFANVQSLRILNTTTWAAVPGPSTLPPTNVLDVAYNPSGSLLAVTTSNAPRINIYRTADWTKLANPASLPASQCRTAMFSDDGSKLFLACDTAPRLIIYNTSNWTRVADPVGLPTSEILDLDLSSSASDTTPDALAFIDESNVATSALLESNIVQINGIISAPISISGQGSPKYRICDDSTCSMDPPWTDSPGKIFNGSFLQLQLTSSPTISTTFNAVVVVGSLSDTWSVGTSAISIPLAQRKLASGVDYSCAITTSGALQCWGSNSDGRQGNGLFMPNYTATTIDVGTSYSFVSIGQNAHHACAITTAGVLKCWGKGTEGQIGNGTTANAMLPVIINKGVAYSHVSTGPMHTCGITSTGVLKCWGNNTNGRLGTGDTSNTTLPVTIDSFVSYKYVSVGDLHSCAITTANRLRCWGNNSTEGALGNNLTDDSLVPIDIDTSFSYKSVSAGYQGTCGITTANALRCWGGSYLGNGTTNRSRVPVVINSGTTYANVSTAAGWAMGTRGCAVGTNGILRCWGNNFNALLGDGTTTTRNSPVVIDSGVTYREVAIGQNHSCAIRTSGVVTCWGTPTLLASLGQEDNSQLLSPKPLTTSQTFTKIYASEYMFGNAAFALTAAGKLWSWGGDHLGSGDYSVYSVPTAVDTANNYSSVVPGYEAQCAIRTSGMLVCWGNSGALLTTSSRSPVNRHSGTTYLSLSNNDYNICGIITGNKLRCWGYNDQGQVGIGNTTNQSNPVAVDAAVDYASVGVGYRFACGLTLTGTLRCWGGNSYGQLASGNFTQRLSPADSDTSRTYDTLAMGDDFVCALSSQKLFCWGSNSYGQLGTGNNTTSNVPVAVDASSDYQMISAGRWHACGLTTGGVLKCWGYNSYGTIGDGTMTNRNSPQIVDSGTLYSWISAGRRSNCAITTSGIAKCWGEPDQDPMGTGGDMTKPSPITSTELY